MLQSNNFHEEELARNRELDYPAGFGHGDLEGNEGGMIMCLQ